MLQLERHTDAYEKSQAFRSLNAAKKANLPQIGALSVWDWIAVHSLKNQLTKCLRLFICLSMCFHPTH